MSAIGEISVQLYAATIDDRHQGIEVFRYDPEALRRPKHEHSSTGSRLTMAALGLAQLVASVCERAQLNSVDSTGRPIPIGREALASAIAAQRHGTWLIARPPALESAPALGYAYIRNDWEGNWAELKLKKDRIINHNLVQFCHLEAANPDLGQNHCRRAVAAILDSVCSRLQDNVTIRVDGRPEGSETRSRVFLETIGLQQPPNAPAWGRDGAFAIGNVLTVSKAIRTNYGLTPS